MSAFTSVPAIGSGSRILDDIDTWTRSAPLRELVRAFGGSEKLFDGGLSCVLAGLDTFSDRWDSRRGSERNMAGALDLTSDQAELVYAAADALGMRSSTPPQRTAYDHVFALGGLVRSCIMRPAYAARLIQSGAITTPEFTALGGHRLFQGDEFHFAGMAGLSNVADEYEALDKGTRRAFRLTAAPSSTGPISTSVNGTWTLRTYKHPSGYLVHVAAAPSTEPDERRANTSDAFQWFARYLAQLQPGQKLLAITTAIYVPAQHAAAIRMLGLPFGVQIETIGIAPHDSILAGLDGFAQTFNGSNYLQEIRAAIQSNRALLDSLSATG